MLASRGKKVTREQNIAAVIRCLCSSICIMNLPDLWTIPFLHGNILARLQASRCWHRNGLARRTTDSVQLRAGLRLACQLAVHQLMLARDIISGRTTGRTGRKHNAPLHGLQRGHKRVKSVLGCYSLDFDYLYSITEL